MARNMLNFSEFLKTLEINFFLIVEPNAKYSCIQPNKF